MSINNPYPATTVAAAAAVAATDATVVAGAVSIIAAYEQGRTTGLDQYAPYEPLLHAQRQVVEAHRRGYLAGSEEQAREWGGREWARREEEAKEMAREHRARVAREHHQLEAMVIGDNEEDREEEGVDEEWEEAEAEEEWEREWMEENEMRMEAAEGWDEMIYGNLW